MSLLRPYSKSGKVERVLANWTVRSLTLGFLEMLHRGLHTSHSLCQFLGRSFSLTLPRVRTCGSERPLQGLPSGPMQFWQPVPLRPQRCLACHLHEMRCLAIRSWRTEFEDEIKKKGMCAITQHMLPNTGKKIGMRLVQAFR